MKEKKQLMVMTSFGIPIPFDVVKGFFPEEFVAEVEAKKGKISESLRSTMHTCVGYYITKLAERAGWKPKKMANYLQNIWNLNPSAAFSMLLREIAVELDKKYKDHINNCEELYIISTMDGRIHKVPRAHIVNFRNFAAFRTEEDAKVACRILRDALKEMFSDRK